MSSPLSSCGSYTPGLAHHPSHAPLGKGRGEPSEGIKPAGRAAASSLICLKYTSSKALTAGGDPYWNQQCLVFYCNYICYSSDVSE